MALKVNQRQKCPTTTHKKAIWPFSFNQILWPDILKLDFLRGQNFSFEILRKKILININKNHLISAKNLEKKM